MIPAFDELELCYRSMAALIAGFDDDQWNTRSLCPEWTTKGVVQHLGGVEHLLTGWRPAEEYEMPPFQLMGEYVEATASLSGAELAARHADVVDARRADIATLTEEVLDHPITSPIGKVPYRRFMPVRVFDWWVHEQDVRRPLGLPGHESGPAAETAIDEIQASLGYIVGKKVDLPDGRAITFDLTGPVRRRMHVRVDGRAGAVDELEEPDVVVSTDSTTFALLACGRIDPQEPIDGGVITWSGDDEWGEQAARNLRFTI
ncbi:MAG: maleylpyruvate isomerase family mycothiol-dependent enzyme [Actinomycetota bacterium]